MEINLKKKELCDLIEKYYKEVEGINSKVTISAKKVSQGYYETLGCEVKITVTKEENILGCIRKVKEELKQVEVLNILKHLMKDSEYEISSLMYDAGISSHCVGYLMNEHTEYFAYFRGITLNAIKRVNAHKLERK